MPKQLRVVHGVSERDDTFSGESGFDVDDTGVLVIKSATGQHVKVYNREVWATAEYEDVER